MVGRLGLGPPHACSCACRLGLGWRSRWAVRPHMGSAGPCPAGLRAEVQIIFFLLLGAGLLTGSLHLFGLCSKPNSRHFPNIYTNCSTNIRFNYQKTKHSGIKYFIVHIGNLDSYYIISSMEESCEDKDGKRINCRSKKLHGSLLQGLL